MKLLHKLEDYDLARCDTRPHHKLQTPFVHSQMLRQILHPKTKFPRRLVGSLSYLPLLGSRMQVSFSQVLPHLTIYLYNYTQASVY